MAIAVPQRVPWAFPLRFVRSIFQAKRFPECLWRSCCFAGHSVFLPSGLPHTTR